jgi:uncharacterized protein (UPF0261 family)
MAKRILIMGSFDTKANELTFLRERVTELGFEAVCMDTSMGRETTVKVEIGSNEVSTAAGVPVNEIRGSSDTRWATEVMAKGGAKIVLDLHGKKRLDGIVAIGGASNTGLSTRIMGALPFGVSKVMVSSMAAVPAYAGSYFGTKDITMIHSVVDIAGLNPLLKSVLARAAAAVCAMADSGGATSLCGGEKGQTRVAITEFKFSEICSRAAAQALSTAGCEVICFHAQGLGDRAMEELIEQGLIDAVLDLVPGGIAEEILGGNRGAGPQRLEAAGRMGIPQVLTPCGFDMLSCGPIERRDRGDALWTSRDLASRKLFIPDALRVQARTSAEEGTLIADTVADKLLAAKGHWRFLIPLKGWSSLSEKGAPLFDPAADDAFARRLKERVDGDRNLRILDLALNTEEFGNIAAETLLSMIGLPTGIESTEGVGNISATKTAKGANAG